MNNFDKGTSEYNVNLKSKKLEDYIRLSINKKEGDITTQDLKQIKSLKISKEVLDDISIGDLSFFSNLESLSLNGIDLGDSELGIINSLSKVQTLSISDAHLDFKKAEYINSNIQHLIFVNCEGVNLEQFCKNPTVKKLTLIGCRDTSYKGIEQFEELEELKLPKNKDLTEDDLKDIWEIESLETVNLDGNPQISEQQHEGIEVSQRSEYLPTESKSWNNQEKKTQRIEISKLANYSIDQIQELSGLDIVVTSEDVSFLKSEHGQELLSQLQANNQFSISLNTTADLSMEEIESLSEQLNINRVYVGTGWETTQNKGYSIETYKAIKEKIMDIGGEINPKMPDIEKFKIIHDKLVQDIKYDYSALSATSRDKDFYASRNLENGLLCNTCVCAGYADILKNVLAEVGIDCRYVEGMTDTGEYHAWNQVRIVDENGREHWYNTDLTWDAVNKDNKFYLLDDKTFSKTHTANLSQTEGREVSECPSSYSYNQVELDYGDEKGR